MNRIIACSLVLLIFTAGATGAETLQVHMRGNRLSVHADQVPVQDILRRIADLGIIVRIDPRVNRPVSASFKDRDIQAGVNSILKGFNHILIWKSIEGLSGDFTRLAEIHVYRPGKKELMKPLGPGTNLRIARDPRNGSLYVENELLLRVGQTMTPSEFERILSNIGGLIIDRNTAQGIYRIRVPANIDIPALADLVSDFGGVEKAEPNFVHPVTVPFRGNTLKGSMTDHLHPSANPPDPEGGVPIAVFDTGVAANSGLEDLLIASFDALNPQDPVSDNLGHGTQMALIAAGIVTPYGAKTDPGETVPVIPIRVFDDNGFTSDFTIMKSIDFALKNGARVLSLSWGSETRSGFLEDAMDYAASKNLVMVASAGNQPTGKPTYPAAYPSVIGVGALTPDGKSWENSNFGNFVAVYAPGFAALPVGYKGEPGIYAGTSISTAFMANLISKYLSDHPKASVQDILNRLNKNN